ncbi:MAG: DNA alkylation repair protein [Leptospirales bacterium]|nr:DNA alkylation repair protein [Leptospirales bacterium]
MTAALLRAELASIAKPQDAVILARFFKTGKGEYGYGDVFIGVKVPPLHKIARRERGLALSETQKLIRSRIHEERLLGLFILTEKFPREDDAGQRKIFDLYIKNKKHINNWDLVDLSAPGVVGEYLRNRDRKLLYKLAKSKSLWDRRIAMLSCFAFIRANDFKTAFEIADLLMKASEDLLHKAVGWMIREIGNRDIKAEEKFLRPRYKKMPRTMLRYAIEKFPEKKRQAYLKGKI